MVQQSKVSKSAPAGKVSCLLCGGFISVSGGDRARFVDHMTNEHDAKTDCHQVLLAACVLDDKERNFLVKSTSRRLDSIGKNRKPNYADTFLSRLTDNIPTAPSYPRPAAPPTSRRRQPVRQAGTWTAPQQRTVQPVHPSLLRNNSSISVSKVDTRRTCNMCQMTLPGPEALIAHMTRNHFNLPGININSAGASSTQRWQPEPRRPPAQLVRSRLSAKSVKMEVVKCPTCGKSVDKSKLAIHKLSHSQQRKPLKPNVMKNKGITLQKMTNDSPSEVNNEDVEVVEINDDPEVASEEASEEVGEANSHEMVPVDNDQDQEQETEKFTEVRNEIEKLDTLELLDNLVNFLQT